MTSPADIAERHSQMLSAFAELSFELAQDLQRRAVAAEDDATAGQLARDFHLVGRSLRQSLALYAKLQREHAEIGEKREQKAAQAREVAVLRRKTEVGKAAERVVWDEFEDEDADFVASLLPGVVDELAEAEDFLDAPLEELVARMRRLCDFDGLHAEVAADREAAGREPAVEASG